MTRLLDGVEYPRDIRRFSVDELNQLAAEIRAEVISVVSEVGGHFASTLGAVELTLALHYVFNTPEDRIVWDTGHQAYAHKLITGRRDRIGTIRQLRGLSGFLSRDESEYDVFGAGHAGTSISAALGMVEAKYLEGSNRKVVAVMSDGGLSAGLIYEGLNSAGHLDRDLIVVLNDNEHFIDPRVGAVSSFLSKQFTTDLGVRLQKNLSSLLRSLPSGENLKYLARKMRDSFLSLVTPGFLFESLGFQYVGPIDGHNISEMITTLDNVKKIEGPTLVHIMTTKGKGYLPAEHDPIKFHGVTPFHVLTGKAKKEKGSIPTYTEVFGQSLLRLAKQNPKIVGITAAMGSGTGIDKLAREIPERTYDVGIAEQHAVTFAGGMATEGYVPVVAIYSTFLQRGYDQILHDVCLQDLHVVFALDRAGLVGADGPTHHGAFDFAYMRSIPNIVIMAPKDENELQHMLKTSIGHSGPISLRYPRGEGWGVEMDAEAQSLEVGKAELLREGTDLIIAAIGQPVIPALRAAQDLAPLGISAAVVNARFVKPLDRELLRDLLTRVPRLITVEDHVIAGGFGSAVVEFLADEGIAGVTVKRLGVPDGFVPHGTQDELRKVCGFDKDAIAQTALQMVRRVKKKSREGWERGSA
jgi:1-deoxy-D-xylulose-5-phosphate synthase